MKYLLLKLEDHEADRMAAKAKARAVGLYEIPTDLCLCEGKAPGEDYAYDKVEKRPVCTECGSIHRLYNENLVARTNWALGRNTL